MKKSVFFKVLVSILAVSLMLCLFACNDTDVTTTEAETKATETEDKATDAATEAPEGDATAEVTETEAPIDDDTETEATGDTSIADDTDAVTDGDTETEVLTEIDTETATETTIETETEIATCEHSVSEYNAYASDNDETTSMALISGVCSKCGETVTKPASFIYSIESIFANDANNAQNVVIFQASESVAPIMGDSKLDFTAGHPYYPAEGLAPINADFPSYGGMIGVSGWGGYLNSTVSDYAAFMITDETGTVLVDWTDMPVILDVIIPRDDVTVLLPSMYTDGFATGVGFYHIINVIPYADVIGGKTVNITFAFKTAQGVDGDVYIPYVTLNNVVVPAAQ